jgi:hypothetical protein
MNCPECGNPLEKEAQYCPKCFARIEPPTFWQKLLRLFQGTGKPRRPVINIKKTVSIKTTDAQGERHEYHSLDELPPDLRKEVERLESEGLKESFCASSSDGPTTNIISRKTGSVFKVRDAAGNERVYHSLEELPPEVRAAWERAGKQRDE